uniref:F-box/LRR-repeat protein 20-like n=1 Tax=Semicossyphus pulcher TaxID=241346 RepID=UPI0037E85C0E
METHPSTTAGRSVSELLEDSGNRRPIIDQELSLHLLSDSLFSEQQKLRHVLDGAHTFLSSRSEVHSEFCRADSVMLADEEQKYQHPVCCDAGGNEVFGGIGGGGCLFPKRTGRNSGVKRHQSGVKDERRCVQTDCKPMPAGVAVSERWLCLPDEVWLSILSLLPLRDLCRVMQVCSRLHTLASDHTLWRSLRVENSTLTEQWFLCVGRRRPRSLSLYSCSGPSLSSCGLETFFSLCGKFLEELQVTSCTGPCLHGDQMLPLIGQWCDHVTGVDVSWSGATDRGVNALSDCCPGLRLKSVVLNGCQVTDDPLMKLVMRHKKSLCRLEVFGCQFLSPSCLQRIFEMCPGLQHLNIGQVPKVNADSLTMMTSQLKGLISLNLTGLQAVNDATVGTLLQGCVKLQSLTLSSCPGVTDLTLHSISKYTPYIRSLDVSSCKAVTDAGVQSLALGCKRLQQLDLSSTSTGNRGVMLLANYCSGHLHTVKLSFCHITSEIILKLCRRCKRLKVLHLYGCARLPPTGDIRRVNSNVKVYPPP